MPTYKVPPEKDYPENAGCCAPSPASKGKKRYPCVYIPASPEIIAALELNQAIEVTLTGKVVGLESSQGENNSRNEIRLELRTVTAEPDEEGADDETAEEDDGGMVDAIKDGLGYKKKDLP